MAIILNRDDRIRVYVRGSFSNDLMKTPVDITLDKVPKDVFERVADIVELLISENVFRRPIKGAKLPRDVNIKGGYPRAKKPGISPLFRYHVEVGNHKDYAGQLEDVLDGYGSETPAGVRILEDLLKEYADEEDLVLKP